MGVGDSWGTREQLLHPRDSKGRFRSTWKMATGVVDKLMKTLSAFNPKIFTSDEEAQTYVHSRARADRTLANRKPAIDRFLRGFSSVNAKLEAGDTSSPDVQVIDGAMRPLPDDLILSRTMPLEAFGLSASNPDQVEELTGKLISSKGYTSTGIGTPFPAGPGQVTMTIATPAGTKGLIPNTSQPSREIILGRDQPLRVTKVEPNGQGGFNILAVATGDSEGEQSVDIGRAVPGDDVEEIPETMGPQAGAGPTGPVRTGRPGRPAGPGPEQRNDGHVGVVGQGAGGATQTPETAETEQAPEVPEIPESGPDARNTFRTAFEESDLKVPSVGTRRKQFMDAYNGVASGKKTPKEAVNDLETAIAANKKIVASDQEDGTDSGPLPEDIKRQEALRDLIAEHFNFTGRKKFKAIEKKEPERKTVDEVDQMERDRRGQIRREMRAERRARGE